MRQKYISLKDHNFGLGPPQPSTQTGSGVELLVERETDCFTATTPTSNQEAENHGEWEIPPNYLMMIYNHAALNAWLIVDIFV